MNKSIFFAGLALILLAGVIGVLLILLASGYFSKEEPIETEPPQAIVEFYEEQ